jgi:hypothetical protein
MAVFPAITPSSLDFTAPQYPVRANTSLSGVVSRRIFGNRAGSAGLTVDYQNIRNSIATQILEAWKSARGTLDAVTLPADVFTGAGPELTAFMADGGDALTWHFAEPPKVTRSALGYSNVSVSFEATRDL